MSQPHPELLILAVTLIAIGLAPLASRLVGRVGSQISNEVDGGRTGETLNTYLDRTYDFMGGGHRNDEVRQMVEARAFLRGEPVPDMPVPTSEDEGLEDEVRQLVIASNERRERAGKEPLDVEAETARRLERYLGA